MGDRCDKAGIPQREQIYRTKPEFTVEILKTLPTIICYDWVGGDCIYGKSLLLRQYLYDKNQSFVLDVGDELGVYFIHSYEKRWSRTNTDCFCL